MLSCRREAGLIACHAQVPRRADLDDISAFRGHDFGVLEIFSPYKQRWQNLKQLEPMAANMAGLRAGLQQMRAQMRARGQVLHQTLRAHSTKAAAAGGGGGLLAFAQS